MLLTPTLCLASLGCDVWSWVFGEPAEPPPLEKNWMEPMDQLNGGGGGRVDLIIQASLVVSRLLDTCLTTLSGAASLTIR